MVYIATSGEYNYRVNQKEVEKKVPVPESRRRKIYRKEKDNSRAGGDQNCGSNAQRFRKIFENIRVRQHFTKPIPYSSTIERVHAAHIL